MFRIRAFFPRQNLQTLAEKLSSDPLFVVTCFGKDSKLSTTTVVVPSSLTTSSHTISNCLIYFQTYFNITYYLCLSPFTIIFNSTSSSYSIYKTKLQNVLCLIIQFSILFQFLGHCRGLDLSLVHADPSNYFEIANVLGTMSYYLILFSSLWTKQKEFLDIFNLLIVIPNNSNNNVNKYLLSKFKLYFKPGILCSIFLGWTIYAVASGLVAYHKYNVLGIPKDYLSRAEFVYLLGPRKNEPGSGSEQQLDNAGVFSGIRENGSILMLVAIWYIFIEFYIWFASYFCDLLVLMAAMFTYQVVLEFFKSLSAEEMTALKALEQFLCLKKVLKKLNSAVGPLVLCVVVAALPYYASNIDTVLSTTDGMRRLRICFYCFVFFFSLAFASQGNLKIGDFKEWLLEQNRGSSIPQASLILIIHELNSFGLKGCGFFTITFGFFGTILSVLLTFSFIFVQFHSANRQIL